jgi:CBS domain-containing protein
MQTRDIMTSPVVTVTPGTGLKDAAAALVEHGINAVPVVDDGRRLVGIRQRPTCSGRRSRGRAPCAR